MSETAFFNLFRNLLSLLGLNMQNRWCGDWVWAWRQSMRQYRDGLSLCVYCFHSVYTALGSALAIPGGLNVKYPPWAHVFQYLVPADDTVWEGPGIFQRWNLVEGSRSLGGGPWSYVAQRHFLCPLCRCISDKPAPCSRHPVFTAMVDCIRL